MDRILYINKVTDTRIREMVNVTGDSTNYDEAKISRSINNIVSQNNYTVSSGNNVTCYTSFQLDENITVSTTGLPNCGSFWGTDTKDWRLYQNKNGNIIITAAEGCKLKSITITYNYANGGNLQHNKYVVPSKTIVAAKGNQISLDVGSSNIAMNGQVKITSITVDYYKPHEEDEGGSQPEHDYTKDYLTFEALEDGTIKFQYNNLREDANGDDELYELFTEGIDIDNNYIEYSTDNGNSWVRLAQVNWDSATIEVSKGDKILTRGVNNTFYANANSYYNTFSFLQGTSHVKVYGNIKTIYGEQELQENCFSNLFGGFQSSNKSELLVDAQYLVLPYTTLTNCCYYYMFYRCTSLRTAPKLPAMTLAYNCYGDMFSSCSSLTTAPELPATTLASSCYSYMFSSCTSLTTAPELPATTLASSCYSNMFAGCTVLTTAPVLPATTLADSCYYYMFYNCSNLNFIKAMFTTEPSTSYTNNWVNGVKSTGTFVKNSAATWNVTGDNGIPTNWTVETASN